MAEWQDPKNFAIGLSIALLFVIILIVSIISLTRIYFKRIVDEQEKLSRAKLDHQQQLLWSSVLTQEKERDRIASELHDGLISKLTVLTYALQAENPNVNPTELLKESIKIARGISHDLRPPLLAQTSINELVEDFISPLEDAYHIKLFFGYHQVVELKSELKLQLFRIVQEVINNILKHANATKIELNIRVTENFISMIISDNGVGFDTSKNVKGLGLQNIELRSQLLKGAGRFKSAAGKGTRFQFCLQNKLNNYIQL